MSKNFWVFSFLFVANLVCAGVLVRPAPMAALFCAFAAGVCVPIVSIEFADRNG